MKDNLLARLRVGAQEPHFDLRQEAADAIEELLATLRPFGEFGQIMLPGSPCDESPWATCPDETPVNNISNYGFTFGMFRAAARLLPEEE
jgi:hypothetical protein